MSKKIVCIFITLIIVAILVLLGIKFFGKPSRETKIKKAEEIMTKFEEGLKKLEIEYTVSSIDVSDYDALVAKMYISGDKRVAIYYIDEDSSSYQENKKNGKIVSHSNSELVVSGIVENGYLFYLEQDFPKADNVYILFDDLTKKA